MLHTWLPSERGAGGTECRVSVFDIEHDMVPPSGGAFFYYSVTPDSARSRWREAGISVSGHPQSAAPPAPRRYMRRALRTLLWIAHRAIHPAGACTSGTADLLFPAIFWVFGRLSVRTIGCFRSVSLTFLHYFVDISCGCSNNCPLFTTRLHPMFTYPRITFKVTPHSGRNKRQTYLSHSQGGVSNVQYPIITRHGQRRHVAGAG